MIRATAQYTPRGDSGRFIATKVTPAVVAGVTAATKLVFDESQILVPVRSGELKASGRMEVEETDKSVVGRVIYDSPHAGVVEFGTGRRGASGDEPGPYAYDPDRAGMPAQPYLRPASDSTREAVREAFAGQVAIGLR